METVNKITIKIIRNAKDGESIRSLANKIGFAYSAVYKWVCALENHGVVSLIRKGNRNVIKIHKNLIYRKFKELDNAISVIEKDGFFWELVKKLKLKIRFVRGTAATIWTQGSFITGDFYDRIYFLEVNEKEVDSFKRTLREHDIAYTKGGVVSKRPLICIVPSKKLNIERKNGLPVMPLNELVSWCKKLRLDNVLEQLDLLYNLNSGVKYSEIRTNIRR